IMAINKRAKRRGAAINPVDSGRAQYRLEDRIKSVEKSKDDQEGGHLSKPVSTANINKSSGEKYTKRQDVNRGKFRCKWLDRNSSRNIRNSCRIHIPAEWNDLHEPINGQCNKRRLEHAPAVSDLATNRTISRPEQQ